MLIVRIVQSSELEGNDQDVHVVTPCSNPGGLSPGGSHNTRHGSYHAGATHGLHLLTDRIGVAEIEEKADVCALTSGA